MYAHLDLARREYGDFDRTAAEKISNGRTGVEVGPRPDEDSFRIFSAQDQHGRFSSQTAARAFRGRDVDCEPEGP